jgi:hypothetical protein
VRLFVTVDAFEHDRDALAGLPAGVARHSRKAGDHRGVDRTLDRILGVIEQFDLLEAVARFKPDIEQQIRRITGAIADTVDDLVGDRRLRATVDGFDLLGG